MKRLLLLLLTFALPASAQMQGMYPPAVGFYVPITTAGNTEYSNNAANNRECFSFIPDETKTLNAAHIELSTVTGTPTAAETDLVLLNDASGLPSGSTIETRDASGAPTGSNTVNSWTGFSSSVTAGTRYWLCIQNTNGTPASNYVRVRIPDTAGQGSPAGYFNAAGHNVKWGWTYCHSTDAGATCGTHRKGYPITRLDFSDSTYAGGGLKGNDYGTEVTNKIYDTRELGVKFTLPAGYPTTNVKCFSFGLTFSGTIPAGGARGRVYSGTGGTRTLLATSTTVPQGNIAAEWTPFCLADPIALAPGTTYSFVVGAVSGGDASNYLALMKVGIHNSAASKALTPFGGTASTYLNATFADDDQKMHPFMLLFDTNASYTVSAGGGSDKNQGINGGLNK